MYVLSITPLSLPPTPYHLSFQLEASSSNLNITTGLKAPLLSRDNNYNNNNSNSVDSQSSLSSQSGSLFTTVSYIL